MTLDAGPELDAQIAREVMGWTDILTSQHNGELVGLPPGASRPRSGNTAHHRLVPKYSTNIAHAWEVVEKMRTGGWIVELEHNPVPESVCKLSRAKTPSPSTPRDWDGPFYATQSTMPLAICRAALAATH